ncbi:hypothetical protein JRT48AECX_JRT48AEC_00059 [Escherichia coli]|nr:hypothetical protein L476_03929 [Escherichia coli BIDMC 39]CAJ1233083.1 hypothetical protein JRT48AECX_JRT48AEC_00059 [Escherichia coli]
MSKEYMNDGSLSEKWKYRFNFYDQHGFPGFWGATPEYKAAFKALKVRQRLTIQMNFIAFFCSWIYLFVLGGNDSNLLIVFYVQIMPDDFVMQLHRF